MFPEALACSQHTSDSHLWSHSAYPSSSHIDLVPTRFISGISSFSVRLGMAQQATPTGIMFPQTPTRHGDHQGHNTEVGGHHPQNPSCCDPGAFLALVGVVRFNFFALVFVPCSSQHIFIYISSVCIIISPVLSQMEARRFREVNWPRVSQLGDACRNSRLPHSAWTLACTPWGDLRPSGAVCSLG